MGLSQLVPFPPQENQDGTNALMETPYNPAALSDANFSSLRLDPCRWVLCTSGPINLTHLWAYVLWQLKALSATRHFQKTKTTLDSLLFYQIVVANLDRWVIAVFFLNEANSVILIKLERGPARSRSVATVHCTQPKKDLEVGPTMKEFLHAQNPSQISNSQLHAKNSQRP